MSDVDILSPKLLYDIGKYVGEIDTALQVCSSDTVWFYITWTCGTSVYNITNSEEEGY